MKKILIICGIMLLFVCSCSENVKVKDCSNDVTEYFLTNNVYRQQEEMMKECPIPLYIISMEEFANGYLAETTYLNDKDNAFDKVNGMYLVGSRVEGWPSEFIFMNSAMEPDEIIGTYFHEMGHYRCHHNRCFCATSGDTGVREAHAILSEIRYGIANRFPIAVFMTVQDIASHWHTKDKRYIPYREAAILIKNTYHWDKALDYLKNEGIGVEIFKTF